MNLSHTRIPLEGCGVQEIHNFQMFFSTHRLQYEGKEHRDRFSLSTRVIDPDKN